MHTVCVWLSVDTMCMEYPPEGRRQESALLIPSVLILAVQPARCCKLPRLNTYRPAYTPIDNWKPDMDQAEAGRMSVNAKEYRTSGLT
jgi:hypothetical protein